MGVRITHRTHVQRVELSLTRNLWRRRPLPFSRQNTGLTDREAYPLPYSGAQILTQSLVMRLQLRGGAVRCVESGVTKYLNPAWGDREYQTSCRPWDTTMSTVTHYTKILAT